MGMVPSKKTKMIVIFIVAIVVIIAGTWFVSGMLRSAPLRINAKCVRDFKENIVNEYDSIKSLNITGMISGMKFEYTLVDEGSSEDIEGIVEKTRVLLSTQEFMDAFNTAYEAKYGDTYYNTVGVAFDGQRDNPRMYISFLVNGSDTTCAEYQFDYPYEVPIVNKPIF